jgi:hypothetical protein
MRADEDTGKEANSDGMSPVPKKGAKRLANTLAAERTYTPDREAMRAALRVVLGLPKRPSFGQEVPA